MQIQNAKYHQRQRPDADADAGAVVQYNGRGEWECRCKAQNTIRGQMQIADGRFECERGCAWVCFLRVIVIVSPRNDTDIDTDAAIVPVMLLSCPSGLDIDAARYLLSQPTSPAN